FDSPAYALPSLVTVQVGDTDLAGQGTLGITATSTTDTNGLVVTLTETPEPGIFVGSFPLIPATNAPVSGKLRAKSSDSLSAKYFDASAGSFVTASAMVDTNPPAIRNISAEPDYEQAVVSWTTSEAADAL